MAKLKRKVRFEQRQADAIETKAINVKKKSAERERRRARMMERIREGNPPYTPEVMSWLSRELDKPSRKITEADVRRLTA